MSINQYQIAQPGHTHGDGPILPTHERRPLRRAPSTESRRSFSLQIPVQDFRLEARAHDPTTWNIEELKHVRAQLFELLKASFSIEVREGFIRFRSITDIIHRFRFVCLDIVVSEPIGTGSPDGFGTISLQLLPIQAETQESV